VRPRLLDLFCCEGGAAMGYQRAGFDVVGVDITPQRRYPFPMIVADALRPPVRLEDFDAIHASPPCQRYSTATNATGDPDDWPDLVEPVRQMLEDSGRPYVIENVAGAPLRPDLTLCGSMFGARYRRHRVFELGRWTIWGAPTCRHADQRRGGPIVDVTGNAGGPNQTPRPGFPIKYHDADHARHVMGMPWASRHGCVEAIPPAYTAFIGAQLLEALR